MIELALFDECQKVRANRSYDYKGRRANVGSVYLIAKLARCAACGGHLRAAIWGKHPGYRCSAFARACTCGAKRRGIAEHHLVPDPKKIMARVQLPDRVKSYARAQLGSDSPATPQQAAARLESQLTRLNKMYQFGNLPVDGNERDTPAIKRQLADLAQSVANPLNLETALDTIENLARLWTVANQTERPELLAAVFEAFKIDLPRRITCIVPKNEFAAIALAAFAQDQESLS